MQYCEKIKEFYTNGNYLNQKTAQGKNSYKTIICSEGIDPLAKTHNMILLNFEIFPKC